MRQPMPGYQGDQFPEKSLTPEQYTRFDKLFLNTNEADWPKDLRDQIAAKEDGDGIWFNEMVAIVCEYVKSHPEAGAPDA